MKIYTLQLNEDGLQLEAATNVRALFNLINECGYEVDGIESYNSVAKQWVKFTRFSYNNLLEAIKYSSADNTMYSWCNIKYEGRTVIEVKEMKLVSKG